MKTKKIRPVFVILLMILLGIGGSWSWSNYGQNAVIAISTGTVVINVKKQENVPLIISAPYVDSNAVKPTYGYSITNVSERTIRAFAIQDDVFYGSNDLKQSGVVLSHLTSKHQLLQQNESRQEIQGGNSSYPEEVNTIVLSVDFVEFDDGSTWGTDYYSSAERLAGQREGAKFAIEFFHQKLKMRGFQILSDDIEQDSIDLVFQADKSKSSAWRSGFESGVGIIRNRLNRAISAAGAEGAKQELKKDLYGGQK